MSRSYPIREVGLLTKKRIDTVDHSVSLEGLTLGVHETEDVFFKIKEPGVVDWVVSRVCDHAGGKLKLCKEDAIARCPLHGWELDTATLRYRNVNENKARIPYRVEGATLSYVGERNCLALPEGLDTAVKTDVTVRFLAHACVAIDVGDVRIVTDPWLMGPCFTTGWWHAVPPKLDATEILRDADLVYISHNHPDHLHVETLRHLPADIPIIVPAFPSKSVTRLLEYIGRVNVKPLEFNIIYALGESGVLLSLLQAGDFRDDSGLFVSAGSFSALLTVDSNALNNYVLPYQVDLLMTSFAGGASGFPLCFEGLEHEERLQISRRNKRAIATMVYRYVEAVNPRVYIPYAGFFTEAAARDVYIKENNEKNTSRGIVQQIAERFPNTMAIDPLESDIVRFTGHVVKPEKIELERLYTLDQDYTERYLAALRAKVANFDIREVRDYFAGSGFSDDLLLYVVPTDDTFMAVGDGIFIDFTGEEVETQIMKSDDLVRTFENSESGKIRHLLIKVRQDSLLHIVKNRLPWEYLSIGFQCRINRKPNVYNSDFWYHFTNVYIGEADG